MTVFYLAGMRLGGKALLTGATLLTLTACDILAPQKRVISTLNLGQPIEVPTEIIAGQPVSVTMFTDQGALVQPDGATVKLIGSVARIVPYDRVSGSEEGKVYPMYILVSPRKVNVVFPTPGPAVIRVVGRKSGSGLDSLDLPVTVQP